MAGLILVLNGGSSTIKASVVAVGGDEAVATTTEEWADDRAATIRRVIEELAADRNIEAVGHRVVHGGHRFIDPALIDEGVLSELNQLGDFAPLHNDVAVDAIRRAREQMADVPHVACFDTSFHATLSEAAWRYPLPWDWAERWGIRRFGFHGLSVEWSVRRAAEALGRPIDATSVVVAHLGSGCSVTAVRNGRSAWTSMGFTPLEGLMMGTRSGSVDPGALLYLLRSGRLGLDELDNVLERESGLLGVSGVRGGMREVRAAAEAGEERAAIAVEMFVARAAESIAAAMTWTSAAALVFTGGIGENDAVTRAQIGERLPGGGVRQLVVEAREDVVIAEATARLIGGG